MIADVANNSVHLYVLKDVTKGNTLGSGVSVSCLKFLKTSSRVQFSDMCQKHIMSMGPQFFGVALLSAT